MTVSDQHYVFQAYLKGFAIERPDTDKFVWVYDKEYPTGGAPRKPKSVRSVCHKKFYYAQKTEGDDIIEKELGKMENEVAPLIESLNVKPSTKVFLDENARGKLAFIIALSMTRVPSFRDPIEKIYRRSVEVLLENNSMNLKGPHGEEFHEFISKIGGAKVSVENWISLQPMIEMAQLIGCSILQKHWQFFKAPDGIMFITSDNPTFFSYPEKIYGQNPFVGPAHPLSEIIFPLRKDVALVCTHKGFHMHAFQASSQEVKKFNRGVVRAARKYVIADLQSDALARLVQKYKGTEQTIIVD